MIEVVLANLHRLASLLGTDRFRSDQQKDMALHAIFEAVNETRLYITRKRRNRLKEENLVRLWAAAAVSIRHYDQDLAERCAIKSEYWINPNNFSEADIQRLRIGIGQVYSEIKDLVRDL